MEDHFDFAAFVTDFLAEEFAKVVQLEVLMWGLAIIYVALPAGSFGGLWITGLFCALSITAGAKLHVVVMSLARHAYAMLYAPTTRGGCSAPCSPAASTGHAATGSGSMPPEGQAATAPATSAAAAASVSPDMTAASCSDVRSHEHLQGGAAVMQRQAEAACTVAKGIACLLYTSPSPRDRTRSRMPSSA